MNEDTPWTWAALLAQLGAGPDPPMPANFNTRQGTNRLKGTHQPDDDDEAGDGGGNEE